MSKFDGGLRTLFRQNLRSGMMWTSIESAGTASGIPDSNYLSDTGVEGWVEFKRTNKNSVVFQPGQVGHLFRRHRYGGRAWIAVRFQHDGGPRKGPPADVLYLVPASRVVALADDGLRGAAPLHCGDGGPARWSWALVRGALLGAVPPPC